MNKRNKLAIIFFLGMSLVNYSSDSDNDYVSETPYTQACYIGEIADDFGQIEIDRVYLLENEQHLARNEERKIFVDWTEVKKILEDELSYSINGLSHSQEHGLTEDQSFVVFPSDKFKKLSTSGLLALVNKRDSVISSK